MARGQPPKFDPAHVEAAEQHFAAGGTVAALARRLGVCRATVYTWLKRELAHLATPAIAPVVPLRASPLAYSLAGWGVPMRPIASSLPIPRRMTADDVDDRLAELAA